MTTRIDHQRSKGQTNNQTTQQQPAVNGTVNNAAGDSRSRSGDLRGDQQSGGTAYEYGQFMHGQPLPQQAAYTSMAMTSPSGAADTFMSNYYQSMNYSNFLGGDTAWSSGTDNLSYMGNYGLTNDYTSMQYAPFDFSQALGWPGYSATDYASWGQQGQQPQVDGTLKMEQQAVSNGQTMEAMYSDYYQTMGNSSSQYLASNGEPTDDLQDLESNMQRVTVSGSGDAPAAVVNGQASPTEVQTTSANEIVSANTNNSSVTSSSSAPSSSKKMSWANVASQPAKPAPAKPQQILTRSAPAAPVDEQWTEKPSHSNGARGNQGQQQANGTAWNAMPRSQRTNGTSSSATSQTSAAVKTILTESEPSPVLDKLKQSNAYNPKSFDLAAKGARFFIIKSYSEDDIHRAIKYSIWCSTEHGNKRLDAAYKEREGKGPIYLLYSVNGSGHFCGMAQMMSGVDYSTQSSVWTQDKWKGRMEIRWIYVKDVPNNQLRHIRLENNENKPVTNSRDTQEVPAEKGRQVLKIIHTYRHTTSIFDDFSHYEKKQVEDDSKRTNGKPVSSSPNQTNARR